MKAIKSRRGVYYDPAFSPYKCKSPSGRELIFQSKKRLQMYERDFEIEIDKVYELIRKEDVLPLLTVGTLLDIEEALSKAVYDRIQGERWENGSLY